MPVEHRHHVQAAVARAELVELAARTRVREQMALADRHELLLRRRAGRQQHERHVVVRRLNGWVSSTGTVDGSVLANLRATVFAPWPGASCVALQNR